MITIMWDDDKAALFTDAQACRLSRTAADNTTYRVGQEIVLDALIYASLLNNWQVTIHAYDKVFELDRSMGSPEWNIPPYHLDLLYDKMMLQTKALEEEL